MITATGLSRIYPTPSGDVVGIEDVSLEVAAGELVVIRGPSGSGKTTLLNLLGGLDTPTSGEVIVGGVNVSEQGDSDRAKLRREHIGFVFQSFGLIPVLTAAENVEVPLRLEKIPAGERERRVAEALESVGLGPHRNQRPDELSGGQQQRVGIARALVASPRVLLADEPTGQLDSETAEVIMALLAELTATRGLAAVIATHDLALMERADRVITLRDGRIRRGRHAAN